MIRNLKIQNFFSTNEIQNLSFVVDSNAPDNNGYFESSNGRISKVNLVVGSNASGKTNILKSISFLRYILCHSFTSQPNASLPFQQFFDSDNNSTLEVEFEIDTKIFTYFVEFNKTLIIKENLKINELIKTRRTTKKLFERKYDLKSKKYSYIDNGFDSANSFSGTNSVLDRKNASLISIGTQFAHPLSVLISNYWNTILINIHEKGYIGQNPFELANALVDFHFNPESKLQVEKMLKKLDLGFESIELDLVEENGNLVFNSVKETHNFSGKICKNDIEYSSNGTKKLVSIIRSIIFGIKFNVPVIIDELEAFLHPELQNAIIDLFFDEEVKCQIIFTSHSHSIMNRLDKQQIFLCEKSRKNGQSEVFRLDEIAEVRSGENYYNKYIAGAYGAIPRI